LFDGLFTLLFSHSYFCLWLQIQVPLFDLYTVFQNLQFEEGTEKINFCGPKAKNAPAFFTDLDGSLDPRPSNLRRMVQSTIMSNDAMMEKFVDLNRCTEVAASCSIHCRNTCFRGIQIGVDPAGTDQYVLRVCKAVDSTSCVDFPGYYRGDDPTNAARSRMFHAYLPTGKYSAAFITPEGNKVWPSYVEVAYQQDGLCPTALKEGDVTVEELIVDANNCSQLIRNGDIEILDGVLPVFWLHRFGGVKVAKGAGIEGTNALTSKLLNANDIIVQFMDNRCMQIMAGHTYEITAWVKLVDRKGIIYSCDPLTETCPEAGITGPWGRDTYAILSGEKNSEGFQLLKGTVPISGRLASKDYAIGFFLRSNTNLAWYIESISMKLIVD